MTDEKINIEILSKIVIQLKSKYTESIMDLTQEITNLKQDHSKQNNELRQMFEIEKIKIREELIELKSKNKEIEKNLMNEIVNIKSKFEKDVLDLREDMLKLLNKYESKFINQDDEIDSIKKKCELTECKVCNYKSFKIHFFNCLDCYSIVCSNCLQVCKNCKGTSCLNCLKKCNFCNESECIKCSILCKYCEGFSCKQCFKNCYICEANKCKKCLNSCRKCDNIFCNNCAMKCERCMLSISCQKCFDKDNSNEKCICGKVYCFSCEDDCENCSIPCVWENNSKIFQGFHTKSSNSLPNRCLLKFFVVSKGIETTHLGLTNDFQFKLSDSPTENFWSICLNTGEKFSTSDYKKKGISWTKYSNPIKEGDFIYLRYFDGEVKFLINRKMMPVAFNLDKKDKYFIYCLTHNDSTQIEIKGMKIMK